LQKRGEGWAPNWVKNAYKNAAGSGIAFSAKMSPLLLLKNHHLLRYFI
jgi:hypothetical protein